MLRRATILASGLAILTMAIASDGCASLSDTIEGQVFIVTKGGENVKLGLVTVALVPEASMRQHIAARQAAAMPEREALKPQIAAARKSYSEAFAGVRAALRDNETASERADRLESELAAGNHSEEAYKKVDEIRNEPLLRAKKWQRELTIRSVALATLEAEYVNWNSGRYFLEMLPAPIARTQSDANGEFTLQVPHKGEYALAARAQRQVLDSVEEYVWLIQMPDEARKGRKVLLSNETLTVGGSPLSLVHTDK